ncbi:anthranilate phosphoribosyltransferase [Vibrio ishigakensis]|uniref:Anthranilate phosphoribosyltransferase n=1 Tax=Vibrio ishigakensis TaxID=1481914 RepID=A0A0B8PCY6_9VIBR|nr:anthranilate phosphoribosyltransferase [Vibrio ishigakensis]
MQQILEKLYDQQSLSIEESQQLFDQIIKGEVDPIVLSAALTALKIKGETPQEIAGAAKALLLTLSLSLVQIMILPIL